MGSTAGDVSEYVRSLIYLTHEYQWCNFEFISQQNNAYVINEY
jgi:hypothetical protein